MRIAKTLTTLGIVGVLALAGCGGDDDDDDSSADATDAPTETDAADDEAQPEEAPDETDAPDDGESAAGEVPDPCELVDADAIAAVLGEDPGAGTVGEVDPTQRKVCTFDNGLILAVEVADNYDASVALIRENSEGATIEDITGVGNAAIWQEFGTSGIGQFVALGDEYFVAASVGTGKESGQNLVELMLTNLAGGAS